jgi:hypothetical protein
VALADQGIHATASCKRATHSGASSLQLAGSGCEDRELLMADQRSELD